MTFRVFGIRHHGPGCARSLVSALEAFEPDCVLLEGPPDGQELLAFVGSEELRPPVALLVYEVDEPNHAVFYPFAVFSPEWQALRYATRRGVPARFIDLPYAQRRGLEKKKRDAAPESADAEPEDGEPDEDGEPGDGESDVDERETEDERLTTDPIALLAEAAGFADPERFWDAQVEQRASAEGLFDAIQEAMTAVRAAVGSGRIRRHEAPREAHMRQGIRKAEKEGFQRIAVVCGAWHVPALAELGGPRGAKADQELLKGLPKIKVASTWIPWTHSRLAFRSGYGAGVDSPGFYAHVFEHGARAPLTWAVRAARLLRGEDLEASAASVIETVRLAETLAVLRELTAPGLFELRESVLSVLCGGDAVRLAVVRDRLEIGEALGEIPEGTPQLPLQRDFEREARRLRLKLTTERLTLDLDLRKDNDRDRSRLFHRLRVLGVPWAEPLSSSRGTGTFRETFHVAWSPEFVVDLTAASVHGNTVPEATRKRLSARAHLADLPELAVLLEVALLADVPEVLAEIGSALDARATQASDVRLLLAACEPLARVIRYGDVRGTSGADVEPVFRSILERATVGLVPACIRIDDDAASTLLEALERAHTSCLLVDRGELRSDWLAALAALLAEDEAHARLRGRACRLLVEQGALDRDALEQHARSSLSRAVEPSSAARFLEGLIAGEGLFLVHHPALLSMLDGWLASLDKEVFQAELPILRRAFTRLAPAERRALGQKLKHASGSALARVAPGEAYDLARAARVVPVLASVLGVTHE
jgi:hypothetical protein